MLRVWAEMALRIVALVLVAFALWRFSHDRGGRAEQRTGSAFVRALPALIASPLSAVHVSFDETPSPLVRDELAAMARAGTRVTWSGRALPPLAISAERVREPSGPVRITVVSTDRVEVRDDLAVLDTLRADSGATFEICAASGAFSARSGQSRAVIAADGASGLKPVLVLGHASWEAKFVVAALEEAGWKVETRFGVAPRADVSKGTPGAPDTSRYAAVVALDSVLGSAGAKLAQFVREGGGLVLVADAANAPLVRQLSPARAGARRVAATRGFDRVVPWSSLALYPLESVRSDAIWLSMQGTLLAAAARREGSGRVVQVGYDETWRWRMQGSGDAVASHRAWWSRLVASVVAFPAPRATESGLAEGAPIARMVESLGAATVAAPDTRSNRLAPWLLPVILVVLFMEWTSRRLRGAR